MVLYPRHSQFVAQLQTVSAVKFGVNTSGQNLRNIRESLNDLGWKRSEVVWFELSPHLKQGYHWTVVCISAPMSKAF